MYWYQVAQDAIKSAEKERERAKYAAAGRDKAERDLKLFTERLIARAASEKATIPLDISRLVELAQCGDIDLSVNIGIYGKDGANSEEGKRIRTERRAGNGYRQTKTTPSETERRIPAKV